MSENEKNKESIPPQKKEKKEVPLSEPLEKKVIVSPIIPDLPEEPSDSDKDDGKD